MKRRAAAVLAIALVLAAAPGCKCAGHAEVPAGARTTAEIRKSGNHLVGQASPYLEKHAHNPVDWYPWGQEAFDRARSEGKPIFLSIGYATCHWCHVMEQESFEDDETAKLLNERFISIKVDRETRPDVDALFLDAVSSLGGSTGWPLNVFLTPELEPYFGGTYFPKVARGGQPSFLSVLAETSRLHREEGPAVARRGKELLAALAAATPKAAGELTELSLTRAFDRLDGSRDAEQGGFGMRQKFPNAPTLLAELRFATRSGDQKARAHVIRTLDRMRRGGVRDQLDGTFHRYAVDRRWQVPHFEKTLYDNAQLASLYLEAGMALGDPELGAVGRAVLDGLERWQRDDGGLVVGFDADDAGGEGAFYTFTPAEIRAAIGEKEAPLVAAALSVTQTGSPELHGRSVLSRRPDAEVAKSFGVGEAVVREAVLRAQPLLLADRAGRPAPPVDDKELSGWNGLALEAYADAARWQGEPRYLDIARRIGTFLVERCRSGPSLARGMRRGTPLGPATLEDYALAARGLLALHAADGDPRWLLAARAFAAAIEKRFLDPESGAFLRIEKAAEDAPLPLARPDASDGPSPSGNSAAALLFLELGAMTGQQAMLDVGTRALARLVPAAIGAPLHHGAALVALDHATSPVREVVIAGDPADPRMTALVHELARTTRARVLPIRVPADGASGDLLRVYPALDEKRAQKSAPTAYVCHRGSCQRPTGDPEVLRAQLAK